jgi:hypothetical protein
MAVFDLYSKRRKRELGNEPDVFTYDNVPQPFRTQIVHMWNEAIGEPYHTSTRMDETEKIQDTYLRIAQVLRREYGVFKLSKASNPNDSSQAKDDLEIWFLAEKDNDRILDAIELTFRVIETFCSRGDYIYGRRNSDIAEEIVKELNCRFKEHGIGYQYTDRKLVRVDSQLIHSEAVIPALRVLRQKHFAGAQEEFLSAYEHHRHGKSEEALVDACKAFESTMKAICDKRGWTYDANRATASELITICLREGLIPSFWQAHFSGLRSVLQSAIATPRNRQGGHGSGTESRTEPPHELTAYVLHMTASTILFLAEAEKNLT